MGESFDGSIIAIDLSMRYHIPQQTGRVNKVLQEDNYLTHSFLIFQDLCLHLTISFRLPFLPPGQEAAVGAIVGDLRGPSPMNRLLQGDVGCGKTVVALMGLMEAVSRGYAPEILHP